MKLPIYEYSRTAAFLLGPFLALAGPAGLFVFPEARGGAAAPATSARRVTVVESAETAEQEAAHERKRQRLPLCNSELRSDDPDFASQRQHCDFNRKKLPLCPEGTTSLDPW